MREINTIIIHCSDTPPDMDVDVEDVRRWHVEDNGWSDIGYHFFIKRDGTIQQGRPLDKVGAHTNGHNEGSIGVCISGGRDGKFDFTKDTMDSLWMLTETLKDGYPVTRISGHNEYSDKACPCFNVPEYFT